MNDLPNWFAVSVVPRKEKSVAEALRAKGYEEFLPLYAARRKWSDRFKTVELPLFPGYVFCRFNPKQQTPILKTPAVMSVIGFGDKPFPVDNGEIEALQAVCSSQLWAMPWPYLQKGARVRIREGPLNGMEGVLLEAEEARFVISITLLQRSVAVAIERSWVVPV